MALISCPGCTNQISSEAVACPQCGRSARPLEPSAAQQSNTPIAVASVVAQRVIVTDIDVSFGQLVWLMIKITFAAIPAAMIVGAIAGIVALVAGLFFGGLAAVFSRH